MLVRSAEIGAYLKVVCKNMCITHNNTKIALERVKKFGGVIFTWQFKCASDMDL